MKKLEIIAKEFDKYFQEFSTEIYNCGYQQGLEDAWKCARKMYQFNPTNNRQLCEELYDMRFNEFICNTTAQQAMQKIKEYELIEQHYYEERQNIKERKCEVCDLFLKDCIGAVMLDGCDFYKKKRTATKKDKSCSNCKYWLLDKNNENRKCKYCFNMDEWVAESEE